MRKKIIIPLAAVCLIVLVGFSAVAVKYRSYGKDHVVVEDQAYPADARELDLRGTGISREHFEKLSGLLPECRILWDVPFQGRAVPSDSEALTVETLTAEDVELLGYFPELRKLDASRCRDYEQLLLLKRQRPRCRISYNVEIGGMELPEDTETLTLKSGESSGQELLQRLSYLDNLKKVHFLEPEIPAEELAALRERYPEICFEWEKTVFGSQYSSSTEFLDLSGMHFDSLEEVFRQTAYLPALKQVDMLNCGFSNEDMQSFRDRVRDRYKVVWNVQVGTMDLRTDVRDFFPDRDHGKVRNQDLYNLRYCEDLLCVDVGHLGHSDLSWVEGTPHLKYLIMSDSGVMDITPLGQLQELEFLELFLTGVRDPSPLLNCRSLRDLNLCRAPLEDISSLAKMTWLEKLWVSHCPISRGERELLRESLPNTYIEFDEYYSTWGGWRDMPRYFDMRDLLEVPYMR